MLPEYYRHQVRSMTQLVFFFRWAGLSLQVELVQLGTVEEFPLAWIIVQASDDTPSWPLIIAKVTKVPIPVVDFNGFTAKSPKQTKYYKVAEAVARFVVSKKTYLIKNLFVRADGAYNSWNWSSIKQS